MSIAPKSSANDSVESGWGVEGELSNGELKLGGGSNGLREDGLVVAEGGGGRNEKADFCGAEVMAVAGMEDWKSVKSSKSSSSSPASKFVVRAAAGREEPGGGASRGATVPELSGALIITGVCEREGCDGGGVNDDAGRGIEAPEIDVLACCACCRAAASGYNCARGISLAEGKPGDIGAGGGGRVKERGIFGRSCCLRDMLSDEGSVAERCVGRGATAAVTVTAGVR